MKPRYLLILTLPLFLLTFSCGLRKPLNGINPLSGSNKPPPMKAQQVLYQWHGQDLTGTTKVRIDLSEQKAYIKKGGKKAGWTYVATGKEGHRTKVGKYKITEKIVDKHSNKYGWIEDEYGNVVDNDAAVGREKVLPGQKYVPAPMPYWMRLTSYGIGMHAGFIPDPGEPASHGCIRLPKPFAPILFENTKVGTVVEIVP